MKKIETAFGTAVRRLREQAEISQEAFADLAEVHRTYVSSIELGKVAVSIAVAQKLAAALGLSLTELFTEVDLELKRK